jgi:hypothetical protein
MEWKKFFLRYFGVAVVLNVTALLFFVLVDPYGTGRLTFIQPIKIQSLPPRLANASRAANLQFDSAIIGNSTSQLLSPTRLGSSTQRSFVNLSVPGTGPLEQIAVLSKFLRHHAGMDGVIVIGLDISWCRAGAMQPQKMTHAFPFWLYEEPWLAYVKGLYSLKSIERSVHRLGVLAGHESAAPLDGYENYEGGRDYNLAEAQRRLADALPHDRQSRIDEKEIEYPQFDVLGKLLERKTVLVFLPRYWPDITAKDRLSLPGCKMKARQIEAQHASIRVLDFMFDGELTQDPRNFWDLEHYRGSVAQYVEQQIASQMRAPTGLAVAH